MKPNKSVTLDTVASLDNLRAAHRYARHGKTHYQSVQEVDADAETLLAKLHDTLISGNYHTSRYKTEIINDCGKERLISKLPYYPDRITHWAIMLQMEPLFMAQFDPCTHAAIPGRGIHTALRQTRGYMLADPEGTRYCLKLDIHHYFPSIDHEILKRMLRRLISDRRLLQLHYEIIDSAAGLPIGNYLSQYYANLYLSAFDRWVKSKNRYYVRYMDDVVVLGRDAAELHALYREIEWYLMRNLRLTVKGNWQVFPVAERGVDFVGYRIRHNSVILRKSTFRRMRAQCFRLRRSAERFGDLTLSEQCSLMSYLGWIMHCTKRTRTDLFERYFAPVLKHLKTKQTTTEAKQ